MLDDVGNFVDTSVTAYLLAIFVLHNNISVILRYHPGMTVMFILASVHILDHSSNSYWIFVFEFDHSS